MTTIAYRDGILAADRQSTLENGRQECAKLWVVDDKAVAVAGVLSDGIKFCKWLRSGKPKDWAVCEESTIIVLSLDTLELVEYDFNMVPMPIYGCFFSWGSGCDFAKGAMEAGACSVKAVDIAMKHDTYSGVGLSILNTNEINEVRNYDDWNHWCCRER